MGFLAATIDINTHDWLYLWGLFSLLWVQIQRKMVSLAVPGLIRQRSHGRPSLNSDGKGFLVDVVGEFWLKEGVGSCGRWRLPSLGSRREAQEKTAFGLLRYIPWWSPDLLALSHL